MLHALEILVEALALDGKDHLSRHMLAVCQFLAKHLGDNRSVPTARIAAGSTHDELLVPQAVGNREGKTNALSHSVCQLFIAHVVLGARTAHVGCGKHDNVRVSMEAIARKANGGNYQRAIAVKLAVDIAAAVLGIPVALLRKNVKKKRMLAQRLLKAHKALVKAAGGIGIRTEIEHGKIAELRAASPVFENCRTRIGVDDANLGHARLLVFRCGLRHRSGHALDASALIASSVDLGGKAYGHLLRIGLALACALVTLSIARSSVPAASAVASVRLVACHALLPFAFAAKGRMISNFAHDSACS